MSLQFKSRFSRLIALTALAGSTGLFWSTESHAVGTRHFVLETGKDFKGGELEGVQVDSRGVLRAGFDLGDIEVPDVDNVWAAVQDGKGLLLATGSEGKLIRVEDGKSKEIAKADVMAVTSIVKAFGKTIVGTMPGGTLYELKGDKLEEFTKLKDGDHIWAMSYDAGSKTLHVATGPEGQLFRVTADGTSQVYFDAEQGHLMSVLAHNGKVYTGSSDPARLYEVSGPGRAKVMYEFDGTEVRSIVPGKKKDLFVTVNNLKGGKRTSAKKSSSGGAGTIYRFDKSGRPEKLYSDSSDHFVTLVVDEKNRPMVGTGAEGRVIRIEKHRRSMVLADVEERQVSAVFLEGNKGWIIASDPVVAHPIEGIGGPDAVWTSEVLDAGIRARFGNMSWDAVGKVELSTRSGNTEKPDESWTDWSAGMTAAGDVKSPSGRYLQVRAKLVDGEKSQLKRIDIPFITDNLRAVITKVTANSSTLTKGSKGVASSGAPMEGSGSTSVKISWDVDNPDQDSLRYRVEYRPENGKTWFDALKPGEVLTGSSRDWETRDLPEGEYRVRVTVTDELSNPPARVKRHFMESEMFLVDNTSPSIDGLTVEGRKLKGIAVDGIGPIQRLELRVAGTEQWIPFEPKDGIFDERKEPFEFSLDDAGIGDKALIAVRVYDTSGNSDVSHIRIPAR